MTDVDDNIDTRTSRKTESSRRRVPAHNELLRFGFLQYVADQRSAGHVRLFPQIASSRETLTAAWSKWWGRYIRRTGLNDRKKVFHSFRHGVKDAFREAEVEELLARTLMGHESRGASHDYGDGHSLARLNDGLQRLGWRMLTIVNGRSALPAFAKTDAISRAQSIGIVSETSAVTWPLFRSKNRIDHR